MPQVRWCGKLSQGFRSDTQAEGLLLLDFDSGQNHSWSEENVEVVETENNSQQTPSIAENSVLWTNSSPIWWNGKSYGKREKGAGMHMDTQIHACTKEKKGGVYILK